MKRENKAITLLTTARSLNFTAVESGGVFNVAMQHSVNGSVSCTTLEQLTVAIQLNSN